MKRYAVTVILLALFAFPARAAIATYHWHQTAASSPGLVFTGQFSVIDDSKPIFADFTDTMPDFGGLMDFHVEGGGAALSLTDLTPGCTESSDPCRPGFPSWALEIIGGRPFFDFLDATGFEYQVTAGSFTTRTSDEGPCSGFDGCWATGFWSAQVPAPATLPVILGGLMLLAGFFTAARGRIRS